MRSVIVTLTFFQTRDTQNSTTEQLSCSSFFTRLTVVEVLFCDMKRGLIPKMCVSCVVITNSVLLLFFFFFSLSLSLSISLYLSLSLSVSLSVSVSLSLLFVLNLLCVVILFLNASSYSCFTIVWGNRVREAPCEHSKKKKPQEAIKSFANL